MISVICIYNNYSIFNECTKKSIEKQKYKNYEFIAIDNTNNEYTNANEAINWGISNSRGNYIIVMHQDLIFDEDLIENINYYIHQVSNFGVLGVAGITRDSKVKSNIYDGIPKHLTTRNSIEAVTRCETLDECLFCFNKENAYFPKKNKTWHLYSVELCLEMKKKGLTNYILPVSLYHKSNAGSYNLSYFQYLLKLLKNEKIIYTTCGVWKKSLVLYYIIFKQRIKEIIR